jgi:hypothetical protein
MEFGVSGDGITLPLQIFQFKIEEDEDYFDDEFEIKLGLEQQVKKGLYK